jgi:hypothetical protein
LSKNSTNDKTNDWAGYAVRGGFGAVVGAFFGIALVTWVLPLTVAPAAALVVGAMVVFAVCSAIYGDSFWYWLREHWLFW